MGRGDWDGYKADVGVKELSPDWRRFVETLADALGTIRSVASPPLSGSDFYGSSANFDLELKHHHPELCVPENAIVPIARKTNWMPEDETPPASGEVCPKCRGAIPPGSENYCPKCYLSGFEVKLARQRGMAGFPPPEPPPKQPPGPRVGAKAERQSTRKAKRAAKRKQGDSDERE